MKSVLLLTILSVAEVFSNPSTPMSVTIYNIPSGNRICDGRVYTPDNIEAHVIFGWKAFRVQMTYSM